MKLKRGQNYFFFFFLSGLRVDEVDAVSLSVRLMEICYQKLLHEVWSSISLGLVKHMNMSQKIS